MKNESAGSSYPALFFSVLRSYNSIAIGQTRSLIAMSSRPITATIITLNEERNIQACLESVFQVCDEAIVVDSESTDQTVGVARASGAKVYVQKYLGDGPQKDYGVKFAKNDWILSIDADERLDEPTIACIKALDLPNTPFDAFAMRRKTFVSNRWMKVWYPDYVVRLYHKHKARYLPIRGHSRVDARVVKRLDCDLLHYSYRDYSDLLRRIDKFASRGAGILYEQHRSVSVLSPLTHSLVAFLKKYLLKRGFLYGLDGLTISIVSAFNTYMKYVLLIEKYRTEREKPSH
jgi:glycosyltransferase involved in cell wall biosynthesis